MNILNHTKRQLEDFADTAEVDLVGRLVLAPGDGGEEECPGVAVARVAVRAQADRRCFCLQLPLFPLLLLLCLPVFLVSARRNFEECCERSPKDQVESSLPFKLL